MSTTVPSSSRVGTIMRKDLRLLWPLATASALLQGALGIVQHRASPFDFGHARILSVVFVTLALVVSIALVIVITIQQDPLPGADQDWVVRPIRRRDLLLAKLLTVALLIHGPIFVVEMLQGLSEGFRFGQILPAALLSNFEIALVFTLPVTAIATMTRSVGEALVGSLVLLVGLILFYVLIAAVHYFITHSGVINEPTSGTGVQWVWYSLSHLWLLAVAVAAVLLQYFRRSTLRARTLFVGGLFLFTLFSYLPWRPAFAVQRWFGPHAQLGRVSMTFAGASSSGRPVPAPTATGALLSTHFIPNTRVEVVPTETPRGSVRVVLPIEVSGLPAGSILHGDHAEIRLSDSRGTIYRGAGRIFDLRVPAQGRALLGQVVELPGAVYQRAVRQPVRLRIAYSLTLLRRRTVSTLPVPGAGRLPQIGRCADRMGPDGKALEVACMVAGAEPPCLAMRLIVPAGARGPHAFNCRLNYEPAALRFSMDPIARFQSLLPLSALDAAARGGGWPRGARVRFALYAPEGHFTRRIVVRGVRLAAWRQISRSRHHPASSTLVLPGQS